MADDIVSPATITVRITPTVDRDYESRGVFPELRIAKAKFTDTGGRVAYFEVTVERGRELLADAERMRLDRNCPKGTPKSYTALVVHLREQLGLDESPLAPVAIAATATVTARTSTRARRAGDLAALRRVAELDAKAKEAEEKVRDLPQTEAEFRELARSAFWRAWGAFELAFMRRDNLLRKSGFRFSCGAREVMEGHMISILWSIDSDAVVIYDEGVRFAEVNKLRLEATKADAPLQRLVQAALQGSIPVDD